MNGRIGDMSGLGIEIRSRLRNDGMGIRENLGLRVGWMLGFVDSWLGQRSSRAERVQVDEGDW